MGSDRYLVITLDDAKRIAQWLRGLPIDKEPIVGARCERWRSGPAGGGGPFWCALAADHEGPCDLSEPAAEAACGTASRIAERFAAESGADMQQIVDGLVRLDICAACNIEGRASSCNALNARQLGRRLRRLLERARGERGPSEGA